MNKLRVLHINTVYRKGSTGKIIAGIESVCNEIGIDTYVAYRYCDTSEKSDNEIPVSSWLDCHVHNRLAMYTGFQGLFSYFKTKQFLKTVDRIKPDIIHIHNIHGSFINHRLLFDYIKSNDIKTIWTLHDCWSFTGFCPHFGIERCEKWRNGCGDCIRCRSERYPIIDCTRIMWSKKKKWFSEVNQLNIVTPSNWLASLVKESFLKDYTVNVINNGIDLNVFRPCESDFRKMHNCENKFVILGVAFDWGMRKGLDVFIELSKIISSDMQIVLVGIEDKMDKLIPDNIITIQRTNNQRELAQIYSSCDLFINPTREDTFPTVNIESLACGTPVLTFQTGGSPEIINDHCGCSVPCDDFEALYEKIMYIKMNNPYSSVDCVKRAASFDMNEKFKEYVELYENCTHIRQCSI